MLAWAVGVTGAALASRLPEEIERLAEAGSALAAGERLKQQAPDRASALLWAAEVWLYSGDPQKAAELAEKARGEGANPGEAALVLAAARFGEGAHNPALAAIDEAVRAGPGVEAHALRGRILEELGEYDLAREAFNAAASAFNGSPAPGRRERLAAAQAAARNRDPTGALRQLEKLQAEAPWMVSAFQEAGDLFLRHYQSGDADLEYKAGLEVAPGSARLLASRAMAAWEEGRLEAALDLARKARAIDPRQPRALQVEARVALFRERFDEARALVAEALAVRARDPGMLALRAEVAAAAGDAQGLELAVRTCLAVNPRYAELDEALGQVAERQYREEDAIEAYTRGIGRRPAASGCLYRRGVLHLHAGRLGAAREDLEKAQYLDPFLVPAVNYLKVIDRLVAFGAEPVPDGYLVLEPGPVSAVADRYRTTVASLLGDLSQRLGHRLSQSHRIEIFADDAWFNARVRGLPGHLFRGVSFGPCLSFSSGETTESAHGWRRVMLHELVHSFNADRVGTGYLPRWFTEGLAVYHEGLRGEHWDGILTGAHWTGDLLPLADLPEGFVRSDRVMLAYMQAGVAMRWIASLRGDAAFDRILDLYRQRVPSLEAISRELGIPVSGLEASYRTFLEGAIRGMGADPVFPVPPIGLMKRAEAGEAEARTRLALVYALRGAMDHAVRMLAGAGGTDLARVRARVMARNRDPAARPALEAAILAHPRDYGLWMDLAAARLAAGHAREGRLALEAAHKVHGSGRAAAFGLLEMARAEGKVETARGVLERFLGADPDHGWAWRELARIERSEGRLDSAAEAFERAIDIDATRPDLFLELARVLAQAGRTERVRANYRAYAGLARRGPLSQESTAAAATKAGAGSPGGAGGAGGPGGASGAGTAPLASWWEPVPLAARQRTLESLVEELREEPERELALAGLADAVARELGESLPGKGSEEDLRHHLIPVMHGAWGREASHVVAVALGFRLEAGASPFLLAQRGCRAPDATGTGTCDQATRHALQALAAREESDLEPWWREHGSKTAEDWFLDSLARRGYPPVPTGVADGREKLLAIVLDDDHWYRSHGARLRLEQALGRVAGRGGDLPDRFRERAFEPVRAQAAQVYRKELEAREIRRRGGKTR